MHEITFKHQDPEVMDEGVNGKVTFQARWTSEDDLALNARGEEIETTKLPKCDRCIWQFQQNCTGMQSTSPRVAGISDRQKCDTAVVWAEAIFTPPKGKDEFLSDLIVDGGQHVRSSVRIFSFPPELPCASPTEVTVQTKEHLLD